MKKDYYEVLVLEVVYATRILFIVTLHHQGSINISVSVKLLRT